MKINKRDLSIIMVIVGIAAVFCVYQFYFSGCLTERESIMQDTDTLRAQYEELSALLDKQMDYVQTISTDKEGISELVSKFPIGYLYEDGIMYLRGLETELNSSNEDGTAYGVYFDSYSIQETTYPESFQGSVGVQGENGFSLKTLNFYFGTATINATYSCNSYTQMKAMLNSVYNEQNENVPKSIETVSINFDSTTGVCSGNILLNMYSFTDSLVEPSNPYNPPEIANQDGTKVSDSTGVDCIFGEVVPVVEEDEKPVTAAPVTETTEE